MVSWPGNAYRGPPLGCSRSRPRRASRPASRPTRLTECHWWKTGVLSVRGRRVGPDRANPTEREPIIGLHGERVRACHRHRQPDLVVHAPCRPRAQSKGCVADPRKWGRHAPSLHHPLLSSIATDGYHFGRNTSWNEVNRVDGGEAVTSKIAESKSTDQRVNHHRAAPRDLTSHLSRTPVRDRTRPQPLRLTRRPPRCFG